MCCSKLEKGGERGGAAVTGESHLPIDNTFISGCTFVMAACINFS
jgi:hypothetical protein